MSSIIQAQCVTMQELNDLFIDLEYEKQQSKVSGVYRSRSFNQKNKKHLQLDEIKAALKLVDRTKIKYIYLMGENAMLHPEFNHILRLCLSLKPVTIYTDGGCINDKKARFLKRVEDEGNNELIFKIFINHYDEKTNDEIAGRGAFRKAIHSISALNKYGFNPILVIKTTIPKNEELINGFRDLGKKFGFETDEINLEFVPDTETINEYESEELPHNHIAQLDCMTSRIVSKSGVYNCPLLLNDYRGRSGGAISDFSTKCYLETDKCSICKSFGKRIYANNWDQI